MVLEYLPVPSRLCLAIAAALACVSSRAQPVTDRAGLECREVAGADLIVNSSKRIVVVGERHGTTEIPSFFGDLVCLISAKGPVVAGFEMSSGQQSALDAYVRSDGSEEEQERLLRQEHWRVHDGRASAAVFELIERLRRMRAAGRDISVIAFMHPGDSPEARESAMARAITEAAERNRGARVIALIGSVHAETEVIGPVAPTASYLPSGERLTLNYIPWMSAGCSDGLCSANGAGAAQISRSAPPEWSWPRYDYYYSVGTRFTPSPPARMVGSVSCVSEQRC